MATSFYGLKSPEERNGWEERGREREGEDRVESVGKPKSQLRDKGRERIIKQSRDLLLWEGKWV